MVAAADDRDRVAAVVRVRPGRRQGDVDRHVAGLVASVISGLPDGIAAEHGRLDLAADERRERGLAAHGLARAGHEQPDRAAGREAGRPAGRRPPRRARPVRSRRGRGRERRRTRPDASRDSGRPVRPPLSRGRCLYGRACRGSTARTGHGYWTTAARRAGIIRSCWSSGACTRATSRTRTSSRTRRAARRCSWTAARRSSRCWRRSRAGGVTPVAVLRTHGAPRPRRARGRARRCRSSPATSRRAACGSRRCRRPGHSDDGVSFVVNGEVVLQRRHALQGRGRRHARPTSTACKHSVMDVLMALPPETRVLPGPHRRDDDRPGVGGEPVRPRLARGRSGGHRAGAASAARTATLVVWSPDYDGKGKAWVRFADGRDAIVGGSRVER